MKNFYLGLFMGLLAGLLVAALIFYDLTKKNVYLRANSEMEQRLRALNYERQPIISN